MVAVGLPLVPFMGAAGLAIGALAAAVVHVTIIGRTIGKQLNFSIGRTVRVSIILWTVAAELHGGSRFKPPR